MTNSLARVPAELGWQLSMLAQIRMLRIGLIVTIAPLLGGCLVIDGFVRPLSDPLDVPHETLKQTLSISTDVTFEPYDVLTDDAGAVQASYQEIVRAAWLRRFPIGTPIEEVLTALPPPEAGTPLPPYTPWSWEQKGANIELYSEAPPGGNCRCAFSIAASFAGEQLSDVDVFYGCDCP